MARALSFNETEVMNKVVQLFWKHGFEKSSIQDLVSATGLNRSSLYHHFGSKEALFLRALDHYVLVFSAERLASLEQGGSVKERLRSYFDDLLHFSLHKGKGLGCLLTNSAVELAPHDEPTKEKLLKNFEKLRQRFLSLLQEAQAKKELANDKDTEALASFFLSTIQGLRVLARAGASEQALRQVVQVALAILD